VKSSKTKSRRLTRQKQGMNEVVELLKSGEGKAEEREGVSLLILDLEPEHGLGELLRLLQQASQTGFAYGAISNFLYVECIDFRFVKDSDKMKSALHEGREKHLRTWIDREDVFTSMSSADFIAFSANCAPFSVFPFPDDICIHLMTGAKMFTSYLNHTEIAREFERRGWQILRGPADIQRDLKEKLAKGEEINPQELGMEDFLTVSKDGFHTTVASGELTRLLIEGLRPKVLIKAREIMRGLGPHSTDGFVLPVYSGESQIWR